MTQHNNNTNNDTNTRKYSQNKKNTQPRTLLINTSRIRQPITRITVTVITTHNHNKEHTKHKKQNPNKKTLIIITRNHIRGTQHNNKHTTHTTNTNKTNTITENTHKQMKLT